MIIEEKIIKNVDDILLDKDSGDFLIKNDPVFGDYNPKCCYQNQKCNLKCCKCIVDVEEMTYDEINENGTPITREVQNFLIETCGVVFKTKIKKETD